MSEGISACSIWPRDYQINLIFEQMLVQIRGRGGPTRSFRLQVMRLCSRWSFTPIQATVACSHRVNSAARVTGELATQLLGATNRTSRCTRGGPRLRIDPIFEVAKALPASGLRSESGCSRNPAFPRPVQCLANIPFSWSDIGEERQHASPPFKACIEQITLFNSSKVELEPGVRSGTWIAIGHTLEHVTHCTAHVLGDQTEHGAPLLLAEIVRMIRRSGLFAPPKYHVTRV